MQLSIKGRKKQVGAQMSKAVEIFCHKSKLLIGWYS